MEGKYNPRSPAVKRLMKEAAELSTPTPDYQAAPLEENLFEWHFTVRGPGDTDFQGGVYHGRILVPADYPMKPPDIIVLTPNGRFEVGKKICLSISGHHPETWQPSWSIRTALLAIIGFMPSPAQGTIGSLDYTPEERQTLARRSQSWSCPTCGSTSGLLAPPGEEQNPEQDKEVKDIVEGLQMKGEEAKSGGGSSPTNTVVEEHPLSSTPAAATLPVSESPHCPLPAASASAASSLAPSVAANAASPPDNAAALAAPAPAASAAPTAPSPAPPAAVPRPRRGRATPARPNQESVGVQVYDFCIMLVVAAIAALLYRRFNIMQTGDNDAGLGD